MTTGIKICGLSTREGIMAAADAGASHVGFVHFAKSPRHLELDQAAQLRRMVPAHMQAVLLLVSMDWPAIRHAVDVVRPDVIQFHGAESPEGCAAVRRETGLTVWKAVGVKDASTLQGSQRFAGAVDMLLYDAPAGSLPGGQGLKVDWSLFSGFRHQMPWGLAGGLNPDNVAEAIRLTGAPLVDTSSGVESAPGVKDIDKIAAFCQAARTAG